MTPAKTQVFGRYAKVAAAFAAAFALAFALIGCSGGETPSSNSSTSSSANSSQSESTASSSTTSSAASSVSTEAASSIDTAAYDQLVAAGPTAADSDIAANSWASAVKESGTLRVGGTRTSTLFSLLNDADGVTRGFDAGLYQLLAGYILGDSSAYDLTQVTSDTRESVLQNDQVDAVFATYSITPSRLAQISFAGPYFESQQGILVKADNTDINGVDDLDGKIVAVQSGSTGPEIVEQYASGAIQQTFSTDEEARTALEQGRVDAYVIDATLHMGNIAKNPGKYRLAGDLFGPADPYGIGLPLDSDGVDFINGFLEKIESDGTWAKLWQITLGDRIGSTDVPTPPTVGDLSSIE